MTELIITRRRPEAVPPPAADTLAWATPYAAVDRLAAEWAWQSRIPVGELTILAGLGGTGKGLLTVDLAARISRGDPLPGCTELQAPGNVLLVSAEDDPNVITVNRLTAAGADISRIFDLSAPGGVPFELPGHLPVLRQAVTETRARLVVLDPLAGIAPIPLTSVARVRGLLAPLRQLAQDTGTAIVITHHLTKGGTVAGSRAIIDGVRSVLTLERDSADESIRVLSVAKSNMGSDDVPLVKYKVVSGTEAACIEYVTETAGEAITAKDQVLAALPDGGSAVTGQEIAARSGMPYSNVRIMLARLVASGRACSPRHGTFSRASTTTGQEIAR
jgi:hypothetical protein